MFKKGISLKPFLGVTFKPQQHPNFAREESSGLITFLTLLIIDTGIRKKIMKSKWVYSICKFMFENWTHEQEKSHTLHEWKVGIQENPYNFGDTFFKTEFCLLCFTVKSLIFRNLVLNGLLHFLPDWFR